MHFVFPLLTLMSSDIYLKKKMLKDTLHWTRRIDHFELNFHDGTE